MSQLTDRIERDLREVAAGAHPSPSAWESISARLGDAVEPEVTPMFAPIVDRSRRRVWMTAAAAVLVVAASVAVLSSDPRDDRSLSTADLDLTATFVSPRNGFSIKHPDRGEGTVTPATQLWGFSERVDDGFDVLNIGSAGVFKAASAADTYFPAADSLDERIDEYLSNDAIFPVGCRTPRSQQASIIIDGQPGRVAECDHIEATVVAGSRLYLFTLVDGRDDARAVFDAYIATVKLTPKTAIDFPAMTTTFVSPTYGYSFKYHDRGGLEPATERWDPVGGQGGNSQQSHQFDGVETGLAAYFSAASTVIPDGVAIDAWYDERVSLSGCSVPRSQQAEIVIDGEPGRIAECQRIEASVVAGGRLYFFTLAHSRTDARAWFEAWLATIDLRP